MCLRQGQISGKQTRAMDAEESSDPHETPLGISHLFQPE